MFDLLAAVSGKPAALAHALIDFHVLQVEVALLLGCWCWVLRW